MARAVVISGTLGAGKTHIAWAVRDLLVAGGARCAIIDLDALCQMEPAPAGDPYNSRLGFRNLAAVWPNYAAAAVAHLVIARVVDGADHRARYEEALAGADVRIVRLDASPATRRARLVSREPEGPWRDGHLRRTDLLAEALLGIDDDLVVSNDERDAADVAAEILSGLGW